MPDALPIPDDLIALQRALEAARAELFEYSAQVTAEYPGQALPEEQAARLNALREGERQAGAAMRQHPTMREALAGHCHHQTDMALRAAAAG
ncbi:hypothetical protein [Kitasatospora sp. NPDC050543]|uniref:hypothetical protein n=1 Tax=Kitasatospora sp. NPDC050543 TaxID=3364054 RepID=UPI00378DE7CC